MKHAPWSCLLLAALGASAGCAADGSAGREPAVARAAHAVQLAPDGRLVATDARGVDHVLSAGATDARVGDDGRVLFAELPAGVTRFEPGTPTRLVLVDLAAGTRRVVSADPEASSPFAVPGSDDVLFVSARTGVASVWLSSPGRAERQVTNVGLTRVGPGFVPVPQRELAWEAGGRVARYVTRYGGTDETWRLDLATGQAARVDATAGEVAR